MLRYCYVSAVNVNNVKERIRPAAHFLGSARDFLEEIEGPGFDPKMERMASDVPYERFLVWPREVESGAKGREGGEGGELSEKERKRQERKNKKKKNFATWQAANAFDQKVMELTLPTLRPPVVVDAGRRNATITWQTYFEKRDGDSGEVTFEVEWDGRAEDGETKLTGMESFNMDSLKPTVVTSPSSHVIRTYTESVKPLFPSSLYHMTVRLCYGTGDDKVCGVRR